MIHRCLICHSEDIKNYYVFTQSNYAGRNYIREKVWRIALPFCEPCHDKDGFDAISNRFANAEFNRLDFQLTVDAYCESLEDQFK